jgi:hypothetical protein
MALTETEIKVIIAAELKKQGFDKAAKATTGLEKTFKKLGKTVLSVFAVREIIRFGKASVNAFAEAEKEAAQLRSQLTGINLEFATPVVDEYIDKLELLTGRTGGDLVNAFNSLSRATEDVTNAQKLLNLALDISAATGKDLGSVSGALQRAYKGEVTAIAKLRVGLTTAELKGKKFAFVVEELERRFSGSTKRATESFGSSVDRLRRSVEQAQEAIGKGFVTGLANSGRSIEETQEKIIEMGENIGEVAAALTNMAIGVGEFFDGLANNRGIKAVLTAFELLTRYGGAMVTGELQPSFASNASRQAGERRRAAEVSARNDLRIRNQMMKQEKINAANRKKIQTEEEKRRRLELARKRAQTIFDMENIQIVAALQGKIDGEQRTRLTTLLAINTENYKAAEKLADIVVRLNEPALRNLGVMIEAGDSVDDLIKKLITSQARLAALQLTAEDFPELDNPFEEWEDSLEKILEMLMKILAMNTKQKVQYTPLPPRPNTGYGSGFSDNEWMRMLQQMEKLGISYNAENFGESGLSGAVGSSVTTNAPTNVIVNVAGNVTTENDLVKRIADEFYQYQKSGSKILFSSTGL